VSEEWRPVPGFPGYDVSNLGRVRAWYNARRNLRSEPRIRKTPPNRAGYPTVTMQADGHPYCPLVHRLVMLAFVGPCPEGMEARHLDGNPGNARLDNLRYGTPKENAADMAAHGTRATGARHGQARFSDAEVEAIRAFVAAGGTHSAAARTFGVSRQYVGDLMSGRRRAA
jgi:hypothetical protein